MITATILAVFATPHAGHFRTERVEALNLDLQGILGDRHYGFTRAAGAREKWYPAGMAMRSGRQVTVVSVEDLELIARTMDLPDVKPEWIGANILIQGVPDFTNIPWGTRLFFENGATLVNEGDNAPCRFAGREVAAHYPGQVDLDLSFVKSAKNRRGIVASVEQAGSIRPGPVRLKIPDNKNWSGGSLI
ncbi:MAG: hypothetical protein P4L54_12380 [Acidocella sp.]|nr:hypothetical protein [Acidocella sp.]